MKTILAMITTLIMGTSFAQAQDRHMIEFDADSVLQGALSFDKSKTPGQKADNDTELDLDLNYAYSVPNWKWLQVGGSFNYLKDTGAAGDVENWGFLAGVIYNHSNDLINSAYASFYAGLNWDKQVGTAEGNSDDEVITSIIAVGKRFPLKLWWDMDHVAYSPEIAFKTQNSTTGGDFEYSQSLEFRFLQFSVLF